MLLRQATSKPVPRLAWAVLMEAISCGTRTHNRQIRSLARYAIAPRGHQPQNRTPLHLGTGSVVIYHGPRKLFTKARATRLLPSLPSRPCPAPGLTTAPSPFQPSPGMQQAVLAHEQHARQPPPYLARVPGGRLGGQVLCQALLKLQRIGRQAAHTKEEATHLV